MLLPIGMIDVVFMLHLQMTILNRYICTWGTWETSYISLKNKKTEKEKNKKNKKTENTHITSSDSIIVLKLISSTSIISFCIYIASYYIFICTKKEKRIWKKELKNIYIYNLYQIFPLVIILITLYTHPFLYYILYYLLFNRLKLMNSIFHHRIIVRTSSESFSNHCHSLYYL